MPGTARILKGALSLPFVLKLIKSQTQPRRRSRLRERRRAGAKRKARQKARATAEGSVQPPSAKLWVPLKAGLCSNGSLRWISLREPYSTRWTSLSGEICPTGGIGDYVNFKEGWIDHNIHIEKFYKKLLELINWYTSTISNRQIHFAGCSFLIFCGLYDIYKSV